MKRKIILQLKQLKRSLLQLPVGLFLFRLKRSVIRFFRQAKNAEDGSILAPGLSAARTVCSQSTAAVTAPTPPGTGVTAAGAMNDYTLPVRN